jgi:hypothetical protein
MSLDSPLSAPSTSLSHCLGDLALTIYNRSHVGHNTAALLPLSTSGCPARQWHGASSRHPSGLPREGIICHGRHGVEIGEI